MPDAGRKSHLDGILLAVSVFTALLFWVTVSIRPFPGSAVLKWFPIGMLALYVLRRRQSRQEWMLAFALLFHSVGDILLDLDRTGYLMVSIGGFLLGHLFYIATFLPDVRKGIRMTAGKKIFVSGVVLYTIVMGVVLLPRLKGFMIGPVVVYMAAIGTMVVMSVLPSYRAKWITLGAVLYIASDSLIAVNQYVTPVPESHFLTWPSYYLGQVLIVMGFLREKSLSS